MIFTFSLFLLFSLFQRKRFSGFGFPFFSKQTKLALSPENCSNEKDQWTENKAEISVTEQTTKKIIENIQGFYGLIGPDVNIQKINTLYDLFTGNGMIQGLFFDHGNVTFIKKYIETEIYLQEKKQQKSSKPFFISNFLNTFNIGAKNLGYANTALLKVENHLYALFERDLPYSIKVDFKRKDIDNLGKISLRGLETFSAHSKFYKERIETTDYHIFAKKVTFFEMTANFTILNKIEIPFRYIPAVHDFYSTEESIILLDTPLSMDTSHLLTKKIPLILDPKGKSYLYVIDKKTHEKKTYVFNESFYLFHYADYIENEDTITIYGSFYDELDFSTIHIKGNYRKMVIDKKKNETRMIRNEEIEKHNLDFPLSFENKIILRSLKNGNYNGFVICKDLTIVKYIELKDYFICGEPKIIWVNKTPFLTFFAFITEENEDYNKEKKNNQFVFINLHNNEKKEIYIPQPLQTGFHSIFIPFS